MAVAIDRRESGSEKMLITPGMAKEWLRANDKNRNLRTRVVSDFARDMLKGVWEYNGETIGFSWDGFLLDGQHRLAALAEAGKTDPDVFIEALVVFGLDPKTQMTMDRGVKRTAADFLRLEGYENPALLAAIIKKVWSWQNGDYKFTQNASPTNSEYKMMVEQNPELFRSVEIAVRVYSRFRRVPKSIAGTAHFLFLQQNPDRVPEFFARLTDGANLHSAHPILTVRERFNSDADSSGKAGRQTASWIQLGYLVRAWDAYVQDRTLAAIVLDPKGDMPMPKSGKKVSDLAEETD